jgi:hypothetical protein
MTDIELPTNGLLVPPDFPMAPYNSIYTRVVATRAQHALYEHHAGAWNALAYRFRSMVDTGQEFASSIARHGDSPLPQERYGQERALFDFYSAGFSVFECTFYGLYAIGVFLQPLTFPLASPEDQQKVTPGSTKKSYEKAFPGAPILKAFSTLFNDPEYQGWRVVRNVLTHRVAPGRVMYVSIGADDVLQTEWKLNKKPIDASLTANGRRELVRLLAALLVAGDGFVQANLK